MEVTRLIIALAMGAVALALIIAFLEPPLGIILGILACGIITGALIRTPILSAITGALAGLAGYIIVYGIGGGGYLGLAVYRELLGPMGPLVPIVYYTLVTGLTSAMVTLITSIRLRRI